MGFHSFTCYRVYPDECFAEATYDMDSPRSARLQSRVQSRDIGCSISIVVEFSYKLAYLPKAPLEWATNSTKELGYDLDPLDDLRLSKHTRYTWSGKKRLLHNDATVSVLYAQ